MREEVDPQVCRMCDAEFAVDGYNIDEEISFCPYCGSVIDSDHDDDLEEEFFDEDNS